MDYEIFSKAAELDYGVNEDAMEALATEWFDAWRDSGEMPLAFEAVVLWCLARLFRAGDADGARRLVEWQGEVVASATNNWSNVEG